MARRYRSMSTPKRSKKAQGAAVVPFGAEYQSSRFCAPGPGRVPFGELCCICGRPVKADHKWVVLNHVDGHRFAKRGDKEDDMSLFAVGPDCAKRCPAELVHDHEWGGEVFA